MWCGRVVACALLVIFVGLALAGTAEAHHRRQYFWVGGGDSLQISGGHGVRPLYSEYTIGGIELECPLKDCTVSILNKRTSTRFGDVCVGNTPHGFWYGCWPISGTTRITGYRYIGIWPSDVAGYGTIDVHAPVDKDYGYGLERSSARLQYVDPSPRVGPSLWELTGAPSPGCYRHYLDVPQDRNRVSAAWTDYRGFAIPPDIYFFDASNVRIGQEAPFDGEARIPVGTAAIMACNAATTNLWGGDLLNPYANAPLLDLWISD